MGDSELGLKAPGMSLAPLLEFGVPGYNTVDSMLQDIDTHLAENNTRIEECVKELMEMSQTLSGVPQKFTHPSDAMIHITENRLLDKEMCFDPDVEAISKLLQNVLQTIDKNPGCEEKVLSQLFELSAAEGLALPFRDSNPLGQSVVSINAAVDSADQRTDKLWNDICMKMKRYYAAELKKLPVGESKPRVFWNRDRALRCVQALCSLVPAEKVWNIYNNVRSQQLDACVKKYIPASSSKSKKVPLATTAEQFVGLVKCAKIMIQEDFEMLSSGVLSTVLSPIAAITEIYLERFTEEVSSVISAVLEELGNPASSVKSPKSRDHRKSKTKEMSKSPSDMGFLGRKIGTPKLQSKSADNLLSHDKDDHQFSDIQVLPPGYLEHLTQLVSALTQLEEHLDSLQAAVIWESMAGIGIKLRPKSGLKSVLKSPPSSGHKLEEIKKSAFSPRSFEKSGLLPEAIPVPYGTSQAMIAQLSANLKGELVEKPADNHVHWPWRLSFTRLASDIARSVENHINAACGKVMTELDTAASNWETVPIETRLVGGRLDYPRKIAICVLPLMNHLDAVLPLAAAGPDQPFDIIRAGFIDITIISLKNLSLKITKMCTDTDSSLPHKMLYSGVSTLAYIRNHILYYENSLGGDENSKRVFPLLYRQYCDAVDRLTRLIIERHTSLLVTCILQDADSHNWEDSKEFYEGERCSFSVQMWYVHMMGLRSDLWSLCPPKLAQSVFAAVLQESVNVLSQRYLAARPTYRRCPQIRADIVAILLITSELFYYSCGTLTHYLDPTPQHTEYYSIHTACCMLLASMAVITAPLDLVYKVYKKGFKKKRSLNEEDTSKGYMSQWLSWMRPQLLPYGKIRPDDLQTTSALYLQLRLLSSKPDINWTLLLQCLLMKDYTLPIMLLTNLAIQHTKNFGQHFPRHTDDARESGTTTVEEVFSVFSSFLLQCGEFQNAFAKVLLPVFERSNTWGIFDMEENLDSYEKIPPWLSAIFHCLESFIIRVLDPGIRVLLCRHYEPVGTEPIALRVRELPCHCPTSNDRDRTLGNKVLSSTSDVVTSVLENLPHYKGSKDVLAEALYSIITQLTNDVYTVPAPVVVFFRAAQRHLDKKSVRTPHDCLGIKILASALRLRLRDISSVESLVGEPLSEGLRSSVEALGECVYHILTAANFSKSSGVPKAAGMFVKANRNWVSDQIDVLTEHFNNDMFELTDAHPLYDVTVEFADHLLTSQASTILNLMNGESSLRLIHKFLLANKAWIISQLDIPPLLGTQAEPQPQKSITLDLKGHEVIDYNPLTAYKKLGDGAFDQAAIIAFPVDYPSLLSSDLGLSEVGLRTLLFHRHDMQEGAYLEENERKHVDSLRKRFHADSPEL